MMHYIKLTVVAVRVGRFKGRSNISRLPSRAAGMRSGESAAGCGEDEQPQGVEGV